MVQTAERTDQTAVKDARDTKAPQHAPALVSQADMHAFSQRAAQTPKPDVVHNNQLDLSNHPYPADNAGARQTPTDLPPVRNAGGDRITTIFDGTGAGVNPNEIQTQKSRLENLTQGMSPDQQRESQKDMAAIEHRQPPLSAEQVNSIYDSTSKLLENKDNQSPLSSNERNQLAAGILHNASLRHEIDQGFHNTCNVTTIEERLNVTNPAEAARVVAEVGLTGQYQSKDGQSIQLDPTSLHADGEARLAFGDQHANGKRDYASQVFDMATINDYWQHQNPPLRYSQTTPTSQTDTGERLKYANGEEVRSPDGKPMRQPGLSTEAMGQIGKSLGMDGQYIISNTRVNGYSENDGTKKVDSYQDFQDALSNGKSPAIILVNTNDPLFGGTGDKGGAGGWHVVSASDYKAGPPAQVFMTNQWGSENNKWVNCSDLYNATIPPGQSGRVASEGGDQGQRQNGYQGHGQGGDQGHGQGSDQGHGQTLDGDGHSGWSSKDGVMTDKDYKDWREKMFHKHWNESDENPGKHNPTAMLTEKIAPLQAMLQDARQRHDKFQSEIIQNEIKTIELRLGQ